MPANANIPDRHNELTQGSVTTVQLLSGEAKKRAFIRNLQEAIGNSGTLSSLSPGPSDNVFVIPQPVEVQLRTQPALATDAGWEAQLRIWGALTVNQLSRDGLFALMQRGTVVLADGPLGGDKVSAVTNVSPAGAGAGTTLTKDFQGPYDWNLGPRGANVAAAWEMFANDTRFAAQLPWDDISVGDVDTGYTEHIALGWAGGKSSTVNVAEGYDFWDGAHDPDPRDE